MIDAGQITQDGSRSTAYPLIYDEKGKRERYQVGNFGQESDYGKNKATTIRDTIGGGRAQTSIYLGRHV